MPSTATAKKAAAKTKPRIAKTNAAKKAAAKTKPRKTKLRKQSKQEQLSGLERLVSKIRILWQVSLAAREAAQTLELELKL